MIRHLFHFGEHDEGKQRKPHNKEKQIGGSEKDLRNEVFCWPYFVICVLYSSLNKMSILQHWDGARAFFFFPRTHEHCVLNSCISQNPCKMH